MSTTKWIAFLAAAGLIAATAGYLSTVRNTLGPPGVKVGGVSIFGTEGQLVSTNSVVLPDEIFGAKAVPVPITTMEVTGLPRDTTFGRRIYRVANDFQAMIGVVLMGSDRTSIHQPQFCLVAQGWSILNTERIAVRMQQPVPYDIPAVRLTTSMRVKDAHGQPATIHGVYIYWFVSGEKITGDQGQRLWSIARTRLEKGFLERWAYITYFSTCPLGQEEATCQRLEKFIQASVPEFQTVAGPSSSRITALASQK
jgi:hypothetical protein